MKRSRKLELFYAIAMLICFTQWVACNNNGDSGDYKKQAPDTTQTFIAFVTPLDWISLGLNGNVPVISSAWRLTKDTFIDKEIDAETKKKIWQRDSIYILEIHISPKDTSKGKRDSVIYPILPKKNVLTDYNKNPNKP